MRHGYTSTLLLNFNEEKRCYYVGENCKGLPDHICQSAGQSGEGREKQFGEVLLHYWVWSIGIIRDPHRRGRSFKISC